MKKSQTEASQKSIIDHPALTLVGDVDSEQSWRTKQEQDEAESDFERAKQALRDLETRDRKRRLEEERRRELAEWRAQLTNEEEAKVQADLLHELYGVPVEIVKTDKEYHSDATYLRTIKEKVYFVSEENPIETCMATEVVIRQHKLRTQTMHANRVDKTSQNKQSLAAKIEEIKKAYSLSHNGEEPSANKLAALLNEHHVETPSGKNKTWYGETVKRVLAGSKPQQQK